MNYYVFNQDVSASPIKTDWESVEDRYLVSMTKVTGLVPVYLDHEEKPRFLDNDEGVPIYGDVISGIFSLYSDRLCDVLKTFDLDVVYRPVKIISREDKSETTGYNMVLRVADGDCIPKDTNYDEGFSIDESQVEGLQLFDHRLDYGSVRIMDETIKQAVVEMGVRGVYIIPTNEYTSDVHSSIMY